MQQRTTTPAGPPAASSSGKQVVELNGYVIILVESRDGKIKLYGSPADKDNLEVADEILDVNERKLEDSPRAEVIKHIHETHSQAHTGGARSLSHDRALLAPFHLALSNVGRVAAFWAGYGGTEWMVQLASTNTRTQAPHDKDVGGGRAEGGVWMRY
uniref:PDZ domain-containing protein n=1 Tax=Anopheles epiroticus TaxID=199890 RepID=A0A182PH70_9DIPT